VPDWEEAFRSKRAAILESLLARRRIFQTDFFYNRYEAPARKNLARSLERLLALST